MIYLHVPFCRSFCTYCDFYSEIACRGRDAQLFEDYTAAVCAEASRRRDEIEATRDLNTLYIGGGTPSVLPLVLIRQMTDAISLRTAQRADEIIFRASLPENQFPLRPPQRQRTPAHLIRSLRSR